MRLMFVFNYTSESCTRFAGSGVASSFERPVIDSNDKCDSVESLIHSLGTFWDSFVCFDEYLPSTSENGFKLQRYMNIIGRQKRKLINQKFAQMCKLE